MMKKQEIYFEDDTFEVSEEVKNMSHEERMKRIKLFEEIGRKEAENILDRNRCWQFDRKTMKNDAI